MSDIFSPANTAKQVTKTIEDAYAALPPGTNEALVLDATLADGVRVLYVRRVGKGWRIVSNVAWNGKGKPTAGFHAIWSR